MRIIDVHTHPILMSENDSREQIDRVVGYGRSFGIEKMVVLGDVLCYGIAPTALQVQAINDKTHRLMQWYPEFFTGFCFLNPVLGEHFVQEETERCILENGFKGIKLEICNNARDTCMRSVMEQAEKLGVVVLQHTADQTNLKQRRFHSDPADTALLGRRFPNVRIIMAHLTACGLRGVLEVADVPNIWIDTSAYLPVAGFVEYAVGILGAKRVLYGSDLVIRDLPSQIGRILAAGLSQQEKEDVLFCNARHLLSIDA